jgi:hypothetical protein
VFAYLLSGFGLSSACGLNAYIPLLILALADRFTTIVELPEPFDVLSSPWTILALLLVLPTELILDKIPRIDAVSDRVHTLIRIPAGAVAMMATTGQADGIPSFVAALLGAAAAAAVHLFKLRSRPAVTRTTAGIANPFVSMIEDFAAVIVSITACLVPYGVLLALPIFGIGIWRLYARMSSGPVRIGSLVLPHSHR